MEVGNLNGQKLRDQHFSEEEYPGHHKTKLCILIKTYFYDQVHKRIRAQTQAIQVSIFLVA